MSTLFSAMWLKLDMAAILATDNYLVVANVPYYISSAILWHFIESPAPPRRLVLTMQYEVAERIVGGSGAKNLLTVAAQFYGRARIIGKLSPAVFWPRPNIDSAIVRIDIHAAAPVSVPSAAAFFRVLRAGFSQKRKQLKNSLAGGLGHQSGGGRKTLASSGYRSQAPRRNPVAGGVGAADADNCWRRARLT